MESASFLSSLLNTKIGDFALLILVISGILTVLDLFVKKINNTIISWRHWGQALGSGTTYTFNGISLRY